MRIPDFVTPIVGYRVWRWDATGLKSLNGDPWYPSRASVASCRVLAQHSSLRSQGENRRHGVPHYQCTCGLYAARSLTNLRRLGLDKYGVEGEVYLWGSMIEHESGWRAEYAYPKSFTLLASRLPATVSAIEERLRILLAFGCDIHVCNQDGILLLWSKNSGYRSDGLDLLLKRSQGWYAQLLAEQRLNCGDRIAALGCGIAVVQDSDAVEIRARLGNGNRIVISRKQIVWDEKNSRWEAKQVTFS